MLVLFDQAIKQVGIPATKSASDLGAFLRHRVFKIAGSRVHTTHEYGDEGGKDAGKRTADRTNCKLLKLQGMVTFLACRMLWVAFDFNEVGEHRTAVNV